MEDSLKGKIERGEFVNLDKLLPRDKTGFSGGHSMADGENVFKFGMKEGHPFVAPANESSAKVNTVRKWTRHFGSMRQYIPMQILPVLVKFGSMSTRYIQQPAPSHGRM